MQPEVEQPLAANTHFADEIRAAVAAGELAGAVAAVSTPRRLRIEAYGFSNIAARTPVERDTIFRIGSMAKTFHTAAALRLIEDRGIDLQQNAAKWLPELAEPRVLRTPDSEIDDTVPAQRPITVHDVLTFQLGLGMYLGQPDTPYFRALRAAGVAPQTEPLAFPADEFMARLGALPLAHQPGDAFMYHTGDDVLRVLISRIAGQPLHEVLEDRVFGPLGMSDAGTSVPASKLHRFSTCYFPQKAPGEALEAWDEADGRFAREPIFPNQLMMTADDFFKYADMLLHDGKAQGRQFLKPETVAMMMSDQLSDAQKRRMPEGGGIWQMRGWGMGATVYTKAIPGGASAGSYSWFGGYGGHYLIDRKRGSAVLSLQSRLALGPAQTSLHAAFELSAYRDVIDAD